MTFFNHFFILLIGLQAMAETILAVDTPFSCHHIAVRSNDAMAHLNSSFNIVVGITCNCLRIPTPWSFLQMIYRLLTLPYKLRELKDSIRPVGPPLIARMYAYNWSPSLNISLGIISVGTRIDCRLLQIRGRRKFTQCTSIHLRLRQKRKLLSFVRQCRDTTTSL